MIPIEEEGDDDGGGVNDDDDARPSQWGTSCHFGRYPKKSDNLRLI